MCRIEEFPPQRDIAAVLSRDADSSSMFPWALNRIVCARKPRAPAEDHSSEISSTTAD
ncbi:hypothetical protein PO909_026310 [Leuciscus waleckii]